MGRATPVTLGPFTFATKSGAKAHLKATRDKYALREDILDDDDIALLLGVLALHPQSAEKIGCGISGFHVDKSPEYPTNCFYLRRTDGSSTDFSWNESLSPTKPAVRLRMAARNAIHPQIVAFKDLHWPSDNYAPRICPITGERFTRSESSVDHTPPATLSDLVLRWLASENLDVSDVAIIHIGDNRSVDEFADPRLRDSWTAFHEIHADLRVVSMSGNLRQGARLLEVTDD